MIRTPSHLPSGAVLGTIDTDRHYQYTGQAGYYIEEQDGMICYIQPHSSLALFGNDAPQNRLQ